MDVIAYQSRCMFLKECALVSLSTQSLASSRNWILLLCYPNWLSDPHKTLLFGSQNTKNIVVQLCAGVIQKGSCYRQTDRQADRQTNTTHMRIAWWFLKPATFLLFLSRNTLHLSISLTDSRKPEQWGNVLSAFMHNTFQIGEVVCKVNFNWL